MDSLNIVPLVIVSDQPELALITGALKEHDIPYQLRDVEASGNYMRIFMGNSVFGVEVQVKEEDYDRAKDLAMTILGPEKFIAPEEVAETDL